MEDANNTSEPLSEQSLHTFYAYAVLPQFGIKDCDIEWQAAEALGGDESLHRFSSEQRSYALIFEDYEGLGSNEAFIKDRLLGDKESYEFVLPISETSISPSYNGLGLPAPSQYCDNVTGTFTLVELFSPDKT